MSLMQVIKNCIQTNMVLLYYLIHQFDYVLSILLPKCDEIIYLQVSFAPIYKNNSNNKAITYVISGSKIVDFKR